MADRTCEKCGKEFRYPRDLRNHRARKTPCALILDLEDLPDVYPPETLEDPDVLLKRCKFCGRIFSSYQAMRRHVRSGCHIAPNERNGTSGIEILYDHVVKRQQAEIDTLKVQNKSIITLMERMSAAEEDGEVLIGEAMPGDAAVRVTARAGGHNQVAVDNRRNVQNITLNFFGQEQTDYLTGDDIREALDTAVGLGIENMPPTERARVAGAVMTRVAGKIFSDIEHPENITMFVPNKRDKCAIVHRQRGWELRDSSEVIPGMVTKSFDTIFDNQPLEEKYAPVLRALIDNEKQFQHGNELRTLMVRNKGYIQKMFGELPSPVGPRAIAAEVAEIADDDEQP
jgi:hypothetical protein